MKINTVTLIVNRASIVLITDYNFDDLLRRIWEQTDTKQHFLLRNYMCVSKYLIEEQILGVDQAQNIKNEK